MNKWLILFFLLNSISVFAQSSPQVTGEDAMPSMVRSEQDMIQSINKVNGSCSSNQNVVESIYENPYRSTCPRSAAPAECRNVHNFTEGLQAFVEDKCESLRPDELSYSADSSKTRDYCACLSNPACIPFAGAVARSQRTRARPQLSTPAQNPKMVQINQLIQVYENRVMSFLRQVNLSRQEKSLPIIQTPSACQPQGILSNIRLMSSMGGIQNSPSCRSENCAATPSLVAYALRRKIGSSVSEMVLATVAVGQNLGISNREEFRELSGVHSAPLNAQVYGEGQDVFVSCLPHQGFENLLVFLPVNQDAQNRINQTYPEKIEVFNQTLASLGNCNNPSKVEDLSKGSREAVGLESALRDSMTLIPEARLLLRPDNLDESLKISNCKKLKGFLEKMKSVHELSLRLASKASPSPTEIRSALSQIDTIKKEAQGFVSFEQGFENVINKNLAKTCNEIVEDAFRVGCANATALLTSYDDTAGVHLNTAVNSGFSSATRALLSNRSAQGIQNERDRIFCNRFPTSPNETSGFPQLVLGGNDSRVIGRGSDSERRTFEENRMSALETVCGKDGEMSFNQFLRRGACSSSSSDFGSCVLNLRSSGRIQELQEEYSRSMAANSIAPSIGGAILSLANSDQSLGLRPGELKMAEDSESNSSRLADQQFESIGRVFGGISSSSDISTSSVANTGSLFNAATTQAFGNQARVSAATSGAVMSRFIAAMPPMQNIPQQQQRQQMDQALERSVNQTVAELENKAAGTTSASERQKYLDEIAELRRLMADQTARNDLITQQMAAMNQAPAEETQAAPTKRRRAPASVASTPAESPEVQSTGFQTGGGRSSGASASSGSLGGSQDLAGAQGFGGGAAAAGRSVSSVSEARDAAPNDNSLRLVVGGAGGQVIPAAQVITISVPSGDEQALKDAILGQRERLNVGEDGYAVVEVIDPASGRASLVRVKIENDNVIVQNFTAEQLRNTTIVSEANPQPRQIRYSLQAMTNLLNQASGGSN